MLHSVSISRSLSRSAKRRRYVFQFHAIFVVILRPRLPLFSRERTKNNTAKLWLIGSNRVSLQWQWKSKHSKSIGWSIIASSFVENKEGKNPRSSGSQLENNSKSDARKIGREGVATGFADWSTPLFTTVDHYLRSICDFLPSLSTHKHRGRNLIKYQSLLAIRVWPMGMLDTRPQFWISIGLFGDWFKGSAKWRINTVYTWETVAALVVFTSFQSHADVPIWIFKISNLNLFSDGILNSKWN